MEDLYLVYVNKIGSDWTENHLYEFLFSNTTENIDGDDWDAYPASGQPLPPDRNFIKRVGRLTSDLKLKLVQESNSFALWDAVDGIISLAWEDIDDYDEYPEKRIAFHFGEEIKSVEDKLYEHDLILEYNNIGKPMENEN